MNSLKFARLRHSGRFSILGILICLVAPLILGLTPPDLESMALSIAAKKTPTPGSSLSSPYDVIALVNQVRAANGLAPFAVNGALMAAAQGHSEYQASIHTVSHTGAGGSNVKSRVLAAGYGGGADVSAVENIYGGSKATAQQAVTWWQGDSLHLSTLLSTRHYEAGAGVATDGNTVYYTLDVGSVVGGTPSNSGAASTAGSTAGAPAATSLSFVPMELATPMPDGSVVHTVQAGQTLWAIAANYKVGLAEVLRINGFGNNTWIYPGQKIIIRPAGTIPSPTPDAAALARTATAEMAALFIPTDTSSPQVKAGASWATQTIPGRQASAPVAVVNAPARPDMTNVILWGIGGVLVLGLVLMAVGNLLNKRGAR